MNEALLASDEEARRLALDPQRSILLQAPAGSGKTAVLTRRFLRLLSTVDDPGEILAITFTLKAAAEMRARVMHALRGEGGMQSSDASELKHLASQALRHGEARGWNLRDDPGALRIQTIDAFNYALASQLPLAARAATALEIADPATVLYQRAARRALLSADADPTLAQAAGLLFERLDNHWYRLERLLAQMLAQRAHWLRFVLDHDARELCARIDASLGTIVTSELALLMRALPAAPLRAAQELPGVGALGASRARLPAWQRLARLTLTRNGWRRTLVARHLGPEYAQEAVRTSLRRLIGELRPITGLEAQLREVERLPAALEAADRALLLALGPLLAHAAAHLQAEFAAAGRVDYTYLAGAARAALSEAGQPTELALRTGLSLRHILVDEFQDTSLAQFELLEGLTSAWEEGDGRTLFVVGDPMQSIYRFRDAEVGLFVTARTHGIGALRLTPLALARNFRSNAALVEWCNRTFRQVFPPADDLRSGAVAFSDSVAVHATPAAPLQETVQLRLFPHDRPGEARALAARVAQLRLAQPDASVAVLLLAHAHATPILAALAERGIPALGVDLVPLAERPIVRDLLALAAALNDLADRSAWLAVLRAPWCGVKLATLTQLSEPDPAPTVWERLADDARLALCPPPERARLERVRAVLGGALARANSHAQADWLESTWLQLGGMDAYPATDLEDARALFDALALRSDAPEWRAAEDLGGLLGELYSAPRADGENPVQIMTIHRAKGLQFAHVFLPSLDRATRGNERPLLEWIDLPRADGGSELLMAPVPATGEEPGQLTRLIGVLNHRRDAHERARLLYVAATRAQHTLWLSGAPDLPRDGEPRPKAGTALATLWPALEEQFRCERAPEAVAPVPRGTGAPLRRLLDGWQPPELAAAPQVPRLPRAASAVPVEFSWVGETQRHVGTIVHALLAQAAQSGSLELPTPAAVRESLRLQGVATDERAAAAELIMQALRRTREDPRGRWILAAHRAGACELALTGVSGGELRSVKIDRTFIDESGTRWVIDFKTGSHEGGDIDAFLERELQRYREQLLGYVALARSLGTEPVRAGLYFPLLGAFRELS